MTGPSLSVAESCGMLNREDISSSIPTVTQPGLGVDLHARDVLSVHFQPGVADPVGEIHIALISSSTDGRQSSTACKSTSGVKLEVVEGPADKSIHTNHLIV